MKPLRFLPLVALAAFALLALKLTGIFFGGGDVLTGTKVTQAQDAAATADKKNKDGQKADQKDAEKAAARGGDVKVGKGKGKGEKAADAKKAADKKKQPPRDVSELQRGPYRTKSEIALLSSLSRRRKQLDKREKSLELRLALLQAAQKRIDERISVLKELKNRVEQFSKKREQANKKKYARLVKMYAGMKPKDAARIFNELDKTVLLGLIREMKPQSMSAILAAMNPDKARETTMALAGASKRRIMDKSLEELPKIEGQ